MGYARTVASVLLAALVVLAGSGRSSFALGTHASGGVPLVTAVAAIDGGAAQMMHSVAAGAPAGNAERSSITYPRCGVQFTYTLQPHRTALFYTYGWQAERVVDWTVVDDTVDTRGQADVALTRIATQRPDVHHLTYWLTVQNLSSNSQAIEGRYCYLS